MDYSEIYFAVATVSTIAVATIMLLCLLYFLKILYDIKKMSKIARKEVEIIAKGLEKGAGVFASDLSTETISFARTIFALLLSQFAPSKTRSNVKRVVKFSKSE